MSSSPEVTRAAVAMLKQLFTRNGIERIPADSSLEKTAADILGLADLERARQVDALLKREVELP